MSWVSHDPLFAGGMDLTQVDEKEQTIDTNLSPECTKNDIPECLQKQKFMENGTFLDDFAKGTTECLAFFEVGIA